MNLSCFTSCYIAPLEIFKTVGLVAQQAFVLAIFAMLAVVILVISFSSGKDFLNILSWTFFESSTQFRSRFNRWFARTEHSPTA